MMNLKNRIYWPKCAPIFAQNWTFFLALKGSGARYFKREYTFLAFFFGFLLTVLSILNTGLHISHILLTEVVTAIWTFLRLDISLISTIRNVWAFNHFFQL